MVRGDGDVWAATSALLKPGVRYSIRANGPSTPGHHFDASRHLIDPYARGLDRAADGDWRSYVQEPDTFDWGTSVKPAIGMDHTVLYEAHAKGISKLNPDVPEDLRGTYADCELMLKKIEPVFKWPSRVGRALLLSQGHHSGDILF